MILFCSSRSYKNHVRYRKFCKRGMGVSLKDINLLYGLSKPKREYSFQSGMKNLLVVLVIFSALLTGVWAVLKSQTSRYGSLVLQLQEQELSYYGVNNERLKLAQSKSKLESIGMVLQTAQSAAHVDLELLDGVSGAMVQNSFLTSLIVDQTGAVDVRAVAADRDDIPVILYRLKETGLFSGVSMEAVTLVQPADGSAAYYEFSLSGSLEASKSAEDQSLLSGSGLAEDEAGGGAE